LGITEKELITSISLVGKDNENYKFELLELIDVKFEPCVKKLE
jgi:hypothetical protein